MNAKETKQNIDCPRCKGFIPSNETPGFYCGAISRADNVTEVCSACGEEEAMEQWEYKFVTPAKHWPVVSDRHDERVTIEFNKIVATLSSDEV